MGIPVRVLIVEDSEDDVLLIVRHLKRGGYNPIYERVDTAEAMQEALQRKWDLIISDYSMPKFDPVTALKMVREKYSDVPFIAVSGTFSEPAILQAMKSGASDYLTKDNLARLNLAVARELRDAQLRRESRSLEAQLRQAQKMEAVGRLAGGVAHDFNNLLTVITGYSELLLMKTDLDPSDRTAVEEIKRAGERGSGLTHQLLAFSRRQALEPKVINLNELLIQMEKMLRRLIGEDIDLVTDARADHPKVKIDPGQLEQVIMNLVVNARDAMPSGGKLTIKTENRELDEHFAKAHPGLEPGPFLILSISDNGTGMDSETLSHVFEPFYTTKPQGKGTGLGMATAYGIVKQSGGAITVQSELGVGTTVSISLPETTQTEESAADERRAAASLRGTETILLVEDETRVRKLVREVLAAYGYNVLETSRGEEAIALAGSYDGDIDLILSDVVMPEMSGPEAARQIMAKRPDTRVLYMSGYTDEAIVHHKVSVSGPGYLQKPFLPGTLLAKVREVLGETAAHHAGNKI